MKKPVSSEKDPKVLLRQAEKAAASGEVEKSLGLFESSIRGYLRERKPFKALAAAKVAKTSLGKHPRVHALLIRLFRSLDLKGDLQKELEESCTTLKKDEVPIFKGLTGEEFIELLEIVHLVDVGKGRSLFRQHDTGEDIYLVLDGTLGVYRNGELMSVLLPGDVFGELGFFLQASRSATVRALGKSRLARIPAQDLRPLCRRFAGLRESLEALYHERILIKAGEELRHNPLADPKHDSLTTIRFSRGQVINFDGPADFTIVKHGIVEIDLDEKGVKTKRFLRPGHVVERFFGPARANTDVELIRARIDLLGRETDEG
ncbi:MAG: cyclic nucleotide-binding domain-containing protein [Desulfomonilia bacterium]|jgi:hypothetical protein|uniref:Cyclic nucleotide-binding domain protein n=1 Tax=anaerobic digester metagenome TaxID=1263854 RepID=A0A485M4I6_9ZZZZ|nr:cyclic nucleotide-binding domain-containing protein [Pseudomonadota bacterium]HPD22150.1 cyclic nucleotide-binding domain-containing protein [Deltaproteobacteria bacterium]HPX17860.1 cyclic nucleotide-binding domain-containing protein [Deltaproteobacteria bacterium]HRS55977.1 cyclic nucleotide-binding domain-containing protein [Desulfomonilia bacterium]HRV35597.1 cyclic nucleotide-binding domain-containing protein [Desulfomonilia bacterium]